MPPALASPTHRHLAGMKPWLPWIVGVAVLAVVATGIGREAGAAPRDSAPTAHVGIVTSADGSPIQGAIVTDGALIEVTGADGAFTVRPADLTSATLRVTAAGYADTSISFGSTPGPVTISMQRQPIKAIYFNPRASTTAADFDRLIDLVNATELNAVVIDVKEEVVYFDSQVRFFRRAGSVMPTLDLPAMLARLEAHSIYTIARLVVFKDSYAAETRPDLAVHDIRTGGVWRDMNGAAWVNPLREELWDANIALATEVARLGFDEIQYDYIRFPTDGDVAAMDFGAPVTEQTRVAAITGFLKRSRRALLPIGVKQSADVFGYTTIVPDDLGIGQDLTAIAPLVDYLSPMVYPSHYPDRSLAIDGHPNDFPYQTVAISLASGKEQLGSALPMRPWLQDFDYFGMRPYGDADVRAQIDAAEAVGTSGWMLWDPANRFESGALGPDDGNMRRFRAPKVVLPGTTTRSMSGRRHGKRVDR